jgi:hypothetical protein
MGTFGTLSIPGTNFSCCTGELPWRGNAANTSSIPAGTYRVTWGPSAAFGECYHLEGVPGRSHILIHAGNYCGDREAGWMSDVKGCIILGRKVGFFGSPQKMVNGSRATLRDFVEEMGKAPFELTIEDCESPA